MKAKILSPNETVCEYVTEIMVMQNDPGVKISSMPIFAYGVPYLIFKTKKGILGTKNTGYLTLFGQTITPTYLTIEDDFIIIVYYFKPFALLTLFRTSAKELTDNPTDLLLVNSRYGRELQERLLNSVSVNDMIELLDHYIYSLIVESKVQTQLIYATTRLVSNNYSLDTLSHIQKELFITERTLQRMFNDNIGVSPNLYRRISQFGAAFDQINKDKNIMLTEVSFDLGYSDQSHFIRSFKEFTNLTPKEYITKWLKPHKM